MGHLSLAATTQRRLGYFAVLITLGSLPFVVAAHWVQLFAEVHAVAIALVGLSLVTGIAGQLNLGHAAFMGLGAYLTAWLVGDGWRYDMALGAVIMFAGLVGSLIVILIRRLRGVYLAAATLGLVVALEHAVRNFSGFGRFSVVRMPEISILGWTPAHGLALGPIGLTRIQGYYFATLAVLVCALVVFGRTRRSGLGRRMAAVRDADIAAEAIGVDVTGAKIAAFALAGGFGALGGALLSSARGAINPGDYGILFSIVLVAMLVIGGTTSGVGAYLGAAFVVLLPRVIDTFGGSLPFLAQGSSTAGISSHQMSQVLFGVAAVVILVVEPGGLGAVSTRLRQVILRFPYSATAAR